jgi:hypothetical protein
MDILNPIAQDVSSDLCDVFISVGLSDGIEFEEEFMKNNPTMFGYIIDRVNTPINIKSKKIVHLDQTLSTTKSFKTENLHTFFKTFSNIYLKLNVKGYEIEFFKSLTIEQINKIKILNIILHTDKDLTFPKLISSTHVLAHIEPTNATNVFKCIFVKGSKTSGKVLKVPPNIVEKPRVMLTVKDSKIADKVPPSIVEKPRHMLTVYSSPFPKIRLGRDYDGGYVIADIPNIKYSLLISGGIKDDISFEEDFIKKYKLLCYAFDGTINSPPYTNASINFIQKNIGSEDNLKETNLHRLIENNNNLFVKMDIEGGEVSWIQSLDTSHLDKIEQLAIEFHQSSIDKNTDIFNILNKTHVLIHIHANNCLGLRKHNGVMIPYIFESTYVHKRYFSSPPTLNKDPVPSSLDMRNVESNNEIFMNFPPYVN